MPTVHLLHDVEPTVLALVKQGANRKRIFLMKENGNGSATVGITSRQPILKADGDSWSYFYCVVAEPGSLEDAGIGDGRGSGVDDMWRDAEEIRKAAHYFAKSQRLVTGLHDSVEPYGSVVENAIAQADFTVIDPSGVEQTILKGSWYVGIEPTEEGRKLIDAGEFTGISLEGTGYRTPVELAKSGEDPEKASVLRRLGEMLGITLAPLPKHSGTVESATPDEEDDVADDAKMTALASEVEEIKKSQGAATTAIEGLVGTVNSLIEKLDKKEKEDAPPDPAELKKSIDTLADQVIAMSDSVDKLMDPGSTQHQDPDNLRKRQQANPLAGIFD